MKQALISSPTPINQFCCERSRLASLLVILVLIIQPAWAQDENGLQPFLPPVQPLAPADESDWMQPEQPRGEITLERTPIRGRPVRPDEFAPENLAPDQVPEFIDPTPEITPTETYTDPETAMLVTGDTFFAQGQYRDAVDAYDRLMRSYPTTRHRQAALYRSAVGYRELGQRAAARNYFGTLLKEFTDGPFVGAAAYRMAEENFADSNFRESMRLFSLAADRLEDKNLSLAARFYQARSADELARSPEAREVYSLIAQAPDPNPYRDYALMSLARMAIEGNQKDDAQRSFEALAASTSDPSLKAQALVRAGLFALELGRHEKATGLLVSALSLPDIGDYEEIGKAGLLSALYSAGKYQEVLDAAARYGPVSSPDLAAEAKLIIANSHRQAGNVDQAASLYNTLVREHPSSAQAVQARFSRLVALYNNRDPELPAEVDAFIEAVPESSKANEARLMKAELLFSEGKYAEAAVAYADLVGTDLPERFQPEVIYRLGWSYSQANMLPEAVDALSRFLTDFPTHELAPAALAQRALCLQKAERYPDAVKDFDLLINTYTDSRERELAFVKKGLLQGQTEDTAGMIQTFEQFLEQYPDSVEAARAHYWIGWALFEEKNYDGALMPLDRARKADPAGYGGRATLRIILAHYYQERAEATADEVDAYRPQGEDPALPPSVYRWLGITMHDAGSAERAQRYLEEFTNQTHAVDADAWTYLARARIEMGKDAEALAALEKALEVAEDPFARARASLEIARANIGLKDFEAANAAVRKALEEVPEGPLNGEGLLLQGDIERAKGRYDEAAKAYVRVALLFDDPNLTPRALERAHLCFVQLGQDDEARKAMNDLRTRFPEFQSQL